jgi:polysaccharide pyruvyl transferase WcaK-like protein
MAYCDPRRYWEGDHKKYSDFIQNLALFGSQLIQDQHRLRIFSTDISFDAEAIEDLTFALKRSSSVASPEWIRQDTVAGIHDLLSQMSEVDYVVTCRFHGVVFAHLLNKPVLAISHHPKVSTLMADFGLSEYCVDIRAIDPDSLAALFRRMADNQKDIKTRMAAQVKCRRDILDKQFDELFSRTSPSWID